MLTYWRGTFGGRKGIARKEARGRSDEPRFPAGRRPGRWTETPSRARRSWEGEGISPHGRPVVDGLPVFRPGVARGADVVAFTPVPGNGDRKEAAYPGDFPPLCSPLAREGNLLWTGPDGRSGKEAPTRNALSRKAFRGRPGPCRVLAWPFKGKPQGPDGPAFARRPVRNFADSQWSVFSKGDGGSIRRGRAGG